MFGPNTMTNFFNTNVLHDEIKNEVDRLVKIKFEELKKELLQTYFFNDNLLSREAAAEKLNVSVGTIDNLRKSKKLKGCSIRRSVKFKNSEILEYIRSLN